MRFELPTFNRCCFCLPLRYGLLFWGYFKLIISILLVYPVFTIFTSCVYYGVIYETVFVLVTVSCIANIAEIIMNLVFISAAHMKNYKLIKIFCNYMIFTIVVFTLAWTLMVMTEIYEYVNMGHSISYYWQRLIIYLFLAFVYIVVHLYVLLLARSEAAKLQNNCQFNFSNIGAEAECTLNIRSDPTHTVTQHQRNVNHQ